MRRWIAGGVWRSCRRGQAIDARPLARIARPIRGCFVAGLLAGLASSTGGCAARSTADPSAARVYNAIDFGWTTSTYFVVSEVDGRTVHRKFDRDDSVEIAPGNRRLTVRYYAESLAEARRGASACVVELRAVSGGRYFLEGVVDGERWRARVVSPDAAGEGAQPLGCVFAAGGDWGAVVGGRQRHAVSSLPAGATSVAAPGAESRAAAAVPRRVDLAADLSEPATSEAGDAVGTGATPAAAGARRAVVESAPPAVAGDVPSAAGAPALVAPPPVAAAAPIQAAPAAATDEESFVVSAMRGRGHWGCRAGRYRVEAVRGQVLDLSGNERVRLLGVVPHSEAEYRRVLESAVDTCVELELEPDRSEHGHHDREGNLLAYVRGADGVLLNAEVVRRGAATVDSGERGRYLGELMAAAAEARRGAR